MDGKIAAAGGDRHPCLFHRLIEQAVLGVDPVKGRLLAGAALLQDRIDRSDPGRAMVHIPELQDILAERPDHLDALGLVTGSADEGWCRLQCSDQSLMNGDHVRGLGGVTAWCRHDETGSFR